MVILKSRLIFLFFFVFLVLMVFYKIEANYFTPDEIFYLFSDSMLTDVTVASRYKFVAYIFRFIYEYGEYISLLIVNITIVWFVINKLSKSSNNNDVNY
ncbi:TPA: O159 family O-antigen polymerase, partial [Escherichia coli]